MSIPGVPKRTALNALDAPQLVALGFTEDGGRARAGAFIEARDGRGFELPGVSGGQSERRRTGPTPTAAEAPGQEEENQQEVERGGEWQREWQCQSRLGQTEQESQSEPGCPIIRGAPEPAGPGQRPGAPEDSVPERSLRVPA